MGGLGTNKYYTSMEHLKAMYDTDARKMGFKADSVSAYEEWKRDLKGKLSHILGIRRMKKCGLSPKVLESKQMDGYGRDKAVIETEPGVWMPFYILRPDGLRDGAKRPCIIAAHGHGGGGKEAVAGRTDIPAVREAVERYNYDFGLKFVREGYVVFCPDARGCGERREAIV